MDDDGATAGPAVTLTSAPAASRRGALTVPAGGSAMSGVWRWFRRGNAPLAVLFAAGIACVYLVSLRGGPAVASAQQRAEETHVQAVLAEWRARWERDKSRPGSRALAETFYYETKQRQMPLDGQKGNPFAFKAPPGVVPEPVATPEPPPGVPANNYADALAAAKQLRLQSVLAGPHGATAMISNNILTQGQVIAGWTIQKIEPESVTLVWQDKVFELSMH